MTPQSNKLSLKDFRSAYGIAPKLADTPPVGALLALATFWEACLKSESGGLNGNGAFRYPAAYEAAFDHVAEGMSVPFRDLPIGLQRLMGGRATDVWYSHAEVPGIVEIAPNVLSLITSKWIRRTIPVRDLADHVLTTWAVHHSWPCGATGSAGFGLPPVEYTGGYARLMNRQRFDAPVIFMNGEIHLHAIAYAAALLRFAPDAIVRVLEGTTVESASYVEPLAPRWDWNSDGTSRWDETDPTSIETAPDATGVIDRMILGGHSTTIVSTWDALGMGTGIPLDVAVPALEESARVARLPYAEPDGMEVANRLAWQPSAAQERTVPGGTVSWISRMISSLLSRQTDRNEMKAVSDWSDARYEAIRAKLMGSPLKDFLPELAVQS
jgi:hypothetical protein